MRTRIVTLLVACLILTAGCTGGRSGTGATDATTAATSAATTTATATQTATATATPTPEPTPTAEWSSPTPPHRPTETADDQSNRIESVEFTNTVAAENGDGYKDFDLAVHANTTMKNVDPEHGTVDGEPYFLVVIDGKIVERTKIVLQEDDRQFNITVRQAGLANFDPGKLSVKVLLMDEDTQHDDVFGAWSGEVEYNPN